MQQRPDGFEGMEGGRRRGRRERGGGGSGRGGSARRDQFSQPLNSSSYKTHQPHLPDSARSKLSMRVDAREALMWGTLDPGRPEALWVPEG